MEGIPVEIAKNETQSLVNFVKKEAHYLCCFNNYVENFDQNKERLVAKLKDVNREIKNASGVSRVKNEAQQWVDEAKQLVDVDAKKKEKCFSGWCLNCWWQYRRGKELEAKTLQIDQLLGRTNFDIAAGSADVPSVKHHSLPNFMHFKSRESQFQDLKEALEDENCNIIGLHGLGGTGKTSMATQVGAELEGSKFDKVISLVVSKPPDFKKLRGEIARHLNLNLKDAEKEEQLEKIFSKITSMKEKLLIILDDVWKEFDLTKELGIPSYHHHKGCSVMITTRNSHVCTSMGCQREIHLEILNEKEALTLFLIHAGIDDSSSLMSVARNIVKHCHGVPIVIVAVASTLKGRPSRVWDAALETLQSAKSVLDTDDDNLKKVFEGLKLSYDHLEKEKSKELFLISSLFPEDFEIPSELLIRIGVGMVPFAEVDNYTERRSTILYAIEELRNSSLLLNAEEEVVKMHDLVHEVALLIGGKDTQSILDFEMPIKQDLQYLFWKSDHFLNEFDGKKLEILLIFLEDLEDLKVSDTFFKEMTRLKVLILASLDGRIYTNSLLQPLESLNDIRTLIIMGLELGDICILGNLPSLETLWLLSCSIIKMPEELLKLKKLRLLDVTDCEIKMNNPFEVIEKCSQLEELTFVANEYDKEQKAVISKNASSLALRRFQICLDDLSNELERWHSLSRYFEANDLRQLVSEATFKKLVGTTKLLHLRGYEERRWTNLVPDIVPLDKEVMNDLIFLGLYSWPGIKCLIDTKNYYSDVTAFSNLVELHLSHMDIEDLYRGSLPSGFLKQLKIMKLEDCKKLKSIFQPSTAQSLKQLEEFKIVSCDALECIISYKSLGGQIAGDDGNNDQKSYQLFSKLKTLHIEKCHKLEIILPVLYDGSLQCLEEIRILDCEQLKYIFDKVQGGDHDMLPSLKEMELSEVPDLKGMFRVYHKPMSSSILQRPSSRLSRSNSKEKLPRQDKRSFSCWGHVCCFLHESRATSEDINVAVSRENLLNDIVLQGFLFIRHTKKMNLAYLCLDSASLFTLSMAKMIMWEELTIKRCNGLKHMIKSEADDDNDHINCISIFPKLEKLGVLHCKDLDFLIPSAISVGIKNLKSLTIDDAPGLKYIVGKYPHDDHISTLNQSNELLFDLPILEVICLKDVPNFISICAMNCYLASPSLQEVVLENCNIKSFTDSNVCSEMGQLYLNTTKTLNASNKGFEIVDTTQNLLIQPWNNIRKMRLVNCSKLIWLSTQSISSTILLEDLKVVRCHELKCIVAEIDTDTHMSYYSIFPKLEKLEIEDCNGLEFLFPSKISVGLKNLKFLNIKEAPVLDCIVGKNTRYKDHLSNDKLYFDVPALEVLCFEDVPKIISICSMNYYMASPSLQSVVIRNCSIKAFTERQASVDGAPPFQAAQSLMTESLSSIRQMELFKCSNLISLLTLTTASVILLENLTIRKCHQLKCIVVEEGNTQVTMNYHSIFPKLKKLEIKDCRELEFLFPSSFSIELENLESLTIKDAPELKYVIGKYHHGDHLSNQNQNEELHFDLPALKLIWFEDLPRITSICVLSYLLGWPPLEVRLENCGIKSFANLMVCSNEQDLSWKTIEELDVSIDAIPTFQAAQSLLIQSLSNIKEMRLCDCSNLISLLTLPTASMFLLEDLTIRRCQKLKCIVAEDGDVPAHTNQDSIFPKLKELYVDECDALEYLFPTSIVRSIIYLQSLKIYDSPQLKYVFGRSHHEDNLSQGNHNIQTYIEFPALQELVPLGCTKSC